MSHARAPDCQFQEKIYIPNLTKPDAVGVRTAKRSTEVPLSITRDLGPWTVHLCTPRYIRVSKGYPFRETKSIKRVYKKNDTGHKGRGGERRG